MKPVHKLSLALAALVLLVSCGTSPRVSPPAAAIQQMKIESSIAWLTSHLPGGRGT